ncbi:hypothetical protein [Pseudonocardia sp. TMWB2A]|uniref:hypothetical protein n=1 Tax=Pseudonocardia sp. TMWB2A TaxID=687430 RepID=UPI00307CCC8B
MAKALIIEHRDQIHCWTISGEVLGSAIWSSTQVHSSGGGGYGGHVSAPTIWSSTTTHKRFFVHTDNGQEHEINLDDSSFGVRDGHRVTVVYAQHRDNESGWLVYLVNHDTGQKLRHSASLKDLRGRHKRRWFLLTLMSILAPNAVGLVAVPVWVFFFFKRRARFAELDSAIFEQAASLAVPDARTAQAMLQ